jgi:hypothetical protein
MFESTNPKRAFGSLKPSAGFIPPIAFIEEAVVMKLGADMYTRFNWQDEPIDAQTYYDAAFRHLTSWYAGENTDAQLGVSHLAHVRACCAILIDALASGLIVDNRPKTASVADAIARLTVYAPGQGYVPPEAPAHIEALPAVPAPFHHPDLLGGDDDGA